MIFHKFACILISFFFRIYFRVEVKGARNISKDFSGAVLISNHKSNLDPILLTVFLKRKLFFMAKKELFSVPMLNRIITKLGAFPVDRKFGGNLAVEKAIEIIKNGELVAMFPQGHRTKNIESIKPKTGFVRIAVASNSFVVPCCLKYDRLLPRSRVLVVYGEPIKISRYLDEENLVGKDVNVRDLTNKIWDVVLNLYNENV